MTAPTAKRPASELWAYLFLVYITIMLLYPVIFTKEQSFFIKQDNLHQAYPFLNKLAISLHKGYLPVWDANTFGGRSFAGEIQQGIFYPINLLWCWLLGTPKGIDVYYLDLLVALHYLIAAIGMYKVARTFQLPMMASIATALIFSFTSALGARSAGQTCIFFGLALMPWSIYWVAKYYMVRPFKRYLILAGLMAGLEILAGHMQPFFHTMLIDGIIIAFFEYRRKSTWSHLLVSSAINILLLLVFALIIALPQVYYASEYLSRCYRTVSHGYFIGPGEKVPLFVYAHWFIINLSNLGNLLGQQFVQPDDDNIIYMGILPLSLAILYLFWHRRGNLTAPHSELTKLLYIILAVGVLSVLGYLTFFYLILYEIPFVNQVRQLGRYIILISFSASLLVGLALTYIGGIKSWLFQNAPRLKLYLLAGLALNALYWVIFQQKLVPFSVSIPFLFTFLFFAGLQFPKLSFNFTIAAVVIICLDLFLNPVGYLSTRTGYYPAYFYARNKLIDSLEKSYGKYRMTFDMNDYGLERRNLGDLYNIQTKSGYSATKNKSYSDFIDVDQRLNSEVNALLNIRYVITDKYLDSNFIFKDSIPNLKLYETRNWYPRCYWKRQLGLPGKMIEEENRSSIQQLAYSDQYEKLQVDCAQKDTLIFSENYYPGWECYDNGKKVSIYPATIKNYPPLFRSIVLDKGRHMVELRYKKVFYWF
ncbi:MAG TPA: hypothetical protein VHD83_06000 [Puia sp.]|nr:hypothetical protein [Puia sp.]